MNRFLLSLTDFNLDRTNNRHWESLFRDPDFRLKANFLERLRAMVEKLPPIEQDVIELYYFTKPHKKQEEIAEMLEISQQTVSHRIRCAFKRIRFMMDQPEIDNNRMRLELKAFINNPFTIEVMCDFSITSSQTVTAQNLTRKFGSCSQQRVCWHLNSGIEALRHYMVTEAVFYAEYFENLMRHRNILREVLAGRRRKPNDGADFSAST